MKLNVNFDNLIKETAKIKGLWSLARVIIEQGQSYDNIILTLSEYTNDNSGIIKRTVDGHLSFMIANEVVVIERQPGGETLQPKYLT
ncbi:hypothetical protein, partial [Vibrio sp. 10N.222.46.A1]